MTATARHSAYGYDGLLPTGFPCLSQSLFFLILQVGDRRCEIGAGMPGHVGKRYVSSVVVESLLVMGKDPET